MICGQLRKFPCAAAAAGAAAGAGAVGPAVPAAAVGVVEVSSCSDKRQMGQVVSCSNQL